MILLAFGSNTIEMTAPAPDRREPGPRCPSSAAEEVSRLCLEYGLDLSIWYPADEKDYSDR